jgi:hypothetical protein
VAATDSGKLAMRKKSLNVVGSHGVLPSVARMPSVV